MGIGKFNVGLGGNPAMEYHPIQGGLLLVTSLSLQSGGRFYMVPCSCLGEDQLYICDNKGLPQYVFSWSKHHMNT